MPAKRRASAPIEVPPPPKEGTVMRMSAEPWIPALDPKAPSSAVTETLEQNAERIRLCARYSAMQGMPMLLARGENTTLDAQERSITECIEELVRRASDDGECHAQDNCGIFSVEVVLSQRHGESYSHRTKDLYVVEAEVSIPLEYALVEVPKEHYRVIKKAGDRWFSGS